MKKAFHGRFQQSGETILKMVICHYVLLPEPDLKKHLGAVSVATVFLPRSENDQNSF